jgi:hypothetical protein
MEDEELQIDPKKAKEAKIAARKKLLADKRAQLEAKRNSSLEERKRKIEERKQALLNRKNPISIESKEPSTSTSTDVKEIKKLTPKEVLAKRTAEKKRLAEEQKIKRDSAKMERKMQNKIRSFKINRKLNREEVQKMTDDQILALMEKEKKEKFEASAARTRELQERENRINDPDPNQEWTYVGGDENTANERYKIINTGEKYKGTGLSTEQLWEMNNKGVQQKFNTFEEFDIAAKKHIKDFKSEKKITQNRSDFTKVIPGSFDPDTFGWDSMARKWNKVPDDVKDENNFKQYSPGFLRKKYDELGYFGLVKFLKANGGSYMLGRSGRKGKVTEARKVSGKTKFQ